MARNYAPPGDARPAAAEPLFFLKPPSSLVGPGEAVVLPRGSGRVEHEAELAVVIGRRASRVPRDGALAYVFGYSCACDVTDRDRQKRDGQWTRGKGADTFCPVGPWIETELSPADLEIRCVVGGAERQRGRTSQMLHDVAGLVSLASEMMTLEPGDVILSGTPDGCGPLSDGEEMAITIEGIGTLRSPVRAAQDDGAR